MLIDATDNQYLVFVSPARLAFTFSNMMLGYNNALVLTLYVYSLTYCFLIYGIHSGLKIFSYFSISIMVPKIMQGLILNPFHFSNKSQVGVMWSVIVSQSMFFIITSIHVGSV